MERERTCSFTGHRPEKLPWGQNEADPRCTALKQKLRDAVVTAYEAGFCHFICGMARGSDFYFADTVLALRKKHPEITLEAAIPCAEQCAAWTWEQRSRWERIVAQCDRKTVLQEHYTPGCMIRRNHYMVDHSALVIAVYDGTSGGTRRTLEYAIRQKIPFVDIDPASMR